MSPNREGKRPGEMFRSIFVEVLALWNLATILAERHVSHVWASHFRMQKVVKHVPMTFGVCCYSFALSFSKMWGSMAVECVTPHRYLGGTEKRLCLFRKIFLTCITTVFPVHISQKMKMVRTLAYNVWNFGVQPSSCTSDTRLHWQLFILERYARPKKTSICTMSVGLKSWRVWLKRGRHYLLRVLQRTKNWRVEFGNRLPRFRRKNHMM